MDVNNMKNMIVLKNLPSNMIEEAFVVLKSNVKIHKLELLDNKNGKQEIKKEKLDDTYVVKEAELIIQNYIDKIEQNANENNEDNISLKKKYMKLKIATIVLGIFSFICLVL